MDLATLSATGTMNLQGVVGDPVFEEILAKTGGLLQFTLLFSNFAFTSDPAVVPFQGTVEP